MTEIMSKFAEYVFVAQNHETVNDKFDLAVAGGYISIDVDGWILTDAGFDFEMCDFIAPGGFAAFLKFEDAQACAQLMKPGMTISETQREGIKYFYID